MVKSADAFKNTYVIRVSKKRVKAKLRRAKAKICHPSNLTQHVSPANTNHCVVISKLTVTCISFLGLLAIAALIIPNVVLYLMLPIIFQIRTTNQTNVTQLNISRTHCGGVSSYKQWQNYSVGSNTIFMEIITSSCSFPKTPVYYTSIDGSNLHTDFSGYSSIYTAQTTSFSIYMRNIEGYTVEQMWNYSQIEKWNISWIGVY